MQKAGRLLAAFTGVMCFAMITAHPIARKVLLEDFYMAT